MLRKVITVAWIALLPAFCLAGKAEVYGEALTEGLSITPIAEILSDPDACLAAIGRPINNLAPLVAAMQEGLVNLNIHLDVFPAGEVRGQVFSVGDDD